MLTTKAQQTRQKIYDTAITLFANEGYENTTMRQIATSSECSLGLTYRYFDSKEQIVLALYDNITEAWEETLEALPQATISERFNVTMQTKLQEMTPHRDVLVSIVGVLLNPRSQVGVLNQQMRDQQMRAFQIIDFVLDEATDAPPEKRRDDLRMLLYVAHLLIQLFWLSDPTKDQRATKQLLELTAGLLKQLRRLLRIPLIGNFVSRFAKIAEPVFLPS